METINSIPITKIQRAGKIIQTGAKVGANYLKYYGREVDVRQEVHGHPALLVPDRRQRRD